jgi:WD40 repeat protein
VNADPLQLKSQLMGRLMEDTTTDMIQMLAKARRSGGGPWLCPQSGSLMHPGKGLVRTLDGFSGVALAMTPDGQSVFANRQGQLQELDTATGKPMRTFDIGASSLTEKVLLALGADGRLAVVASVPHVGRGTMKVLDVHAGCIVREFHDYKSPITALVMARDGCHVVSASDDFDWSGFGELKVWDVGTAAVVRTLDEGQGHRYLAVSIVLDGHTVIAGDGCHLVTWDLVTGRRLRKWCAHERVVMNVEVAANGACVLSCSSDGKAKLWEASSGKEICCLNGHTDSVVSALFVNLDKRAITASRDGTLRLWDLRNGDQLGVVEGHDGGLLAVRLIEDKRVAVSLGADGKIRFWDLLRWPASRRQRATITQLVAATSRQMVLLSSPNGTVEAWDAGAHAKLCTWQYPESKASQLLVSPDGNRAVGLFSDGCIQVWDTNSGSQILSRRAPADLQAISTDGSGYAWTHGKRLTVLDLTTGETTVLGEDDRCLASIMFLPCSNRLLAAGKYGGDICAHDLACVADAPVRISVPGDFQACAVSFDGKFCAIASGEYCYAKQEWLHGHTSLNVWGLEEEGYLGSTGRLNGKLGELSFSPDSRFVLFSHQFVPHAWCWRTGSQPVALAAEPPHPFFGILGSIAAVSQEGDLAVTVAPRGVAGSGTMDLFHMHTGVSVRSFHGHSGTVLGVCFLGNSKLVASASKDHSVRVWDIGCSKPIASFHTDRPITCCTFFPKRGRFVVGDTSGNLHFLQLESQSYTEP